MKIIPLSEGAFTVDKTKKFVAFDKENDDLQQRSAGSLLVEVQPFCIVTKRDIIVIDTGLGFTKPDGVLQIHHNLLDNSINPMDVTKVLLSHLHKDHSGGISVEDKVLHHHFLSFPNAIYYVNKEELAFGLDKSNSSYITEDFEILSNSDKVIFTEGNGVIDGYIRYEVTGAHSPFHQVFWIEEDSKTAFFGGDVAPQLQQMKSRFIAKYDFDGKKCMELRQQWWQTGQEEHWTFLFYHDIKTPFVELD
ncbi:MBL fold metallo-hydrolase [Ferruginibacter paludis]|uniref:MBL fold metallo-hydrolase n=1 Tax=Ferruginibacter paludis TaxID=1310417 RepID=UPI0025B61BF4|nr:MBL fold metallo-hydrolase [Ferruginibacter paludis]MDN3658451.1 MBL fold metallo-hydrolase [Ferruginibacter paludis]